MAVVRLRCLRCCISKIALGIGRDEHQVGACLHVAHPGEGIDELRVLGKLVVVAAAAAREGRPE